MNNLKKDPTTAQDILEQSLWLNKSINIYNKMVYWKHWITAGIVYLNDITHNGTFLTHKEIQIIYNIETTFLATMQIQDKIPKKWKHILKQYTYTAPISNIKNSIHINKSKKELEKIKYKDIYWHLINNIQHTPKAIISWENVYSNFKNKGNIFWNNIFKMQFIRTRDTSIQSFQYQILHRGLPCNEWLNNIKINSEKTCYYCNEIDTITHFLIECKSNKYFWKGWSRWWHFITGFNLREEDYIHEYILFGFPRKSDNTIVADYCILYAKQYINLEKLKNKNTNFNVDFLGYLSHLKYILKMEESICIKNNQKLKFDMLIIIYENL